MRYYVMSLKVCTETIQVLQDLSFDVDYTFPDKYINVYINTLTAYSSSLLIRKLRTIEQLQQIMLCPTDEVKAALMETF